MTTFTTALHIALLIFIVIVLFNIIIFVHELGHFLAGKWRGLQIDRFQIWFGKPIWKKEYRGVLYGLGWIPAGGFVALPQMAPMETIEGENTRETPLPAISPLDKIIVAFAGPLFSILLALAFGLIVWKVGKPKDFVPCQTIGYVEPGSPAQQAGLLPGDKIISINGKTVNGFAGTFNSVIESIVLSRGEQITLTIERPGHAQPLEIHSKFSIDQTNGLQRRALRKIGILSAESSLNVAAVMEHSPAAKAGLQPGDQLTHLNGTPLLHHKQFSEFFKANPTQAANVTVLKKDQSTQQISIQAVKPLQPADAPPMVGLLWGDSNDVDTQIVHPTPFTQIYDSINMMWVTISSVADRDTSIGIDHLSGPIGIGTLLYQLLQTEDGWRRILAFMVLFNVNLAVLNMLPFPVLDGGHITLAILEKIFRRPIKARPLEIMQTTCALALIGLMLYISLKDASDHIFKPKPSQRQEVIFPS